MKDYCTMFPEKWVVWDSLFRWRVIYIGDICKKHDENCGSHGFYKGLWNARVVGAVAIATVASIACWVRYTKKMIKKV